MCFVNMIGSNFHANKFKSRGIKAKKLIVTKK